MKSLLTTLVVLLPTCFANADPVRVFIFAGQSNMEGADSRVEDVKTFPPFEGLQNPQPNVRFAYCLGRENKTQSKGWEVLRPVRNMVGPELSFARKVVSESNATIAIIKCAAGGTHLGGDWNPDDPKGFKMYPLALEFVKSSLADLKNQGVEYQLEGFMWHQGENDMFEADYMSNYGKNLKNFFASWRRDLNAPMLRFYVGELCTKTIWGMDLRPRMHAISLGQKEVTSADPLADFVPTSHVGVEIGNPVGLHYHYGTLGQLEHGENYAEAYLKTLGVKRKPRKLEVWPYKAKSPVSLFVFAGHRNMEGERAFVQQLTEGDKALAIDRNDVAFKYSVGGGYRLSHNWEPLGLVGLYDNFGPELSFSRKLTAASTEPFAIAKFTHSGSQIIDWTPEGSDAKTRNLYPKFLAFVKDAQSELAAKGHEVDTTIIYHVGENDMSFNPYRKAAADRVRAMVEQLAIDLGGSQKWIISQQSPTDEKGVNGIDVVKDFRDFAASNGSVRHILVDVPGRDKRLG